MCQQKAKEASRLENTTTKGRIPYGDRRPMTLVVVSTDGEYIDNAYVEQSSDETIN